MNNKIPQWRLIYDSPAPGAWNMAVDEAIMESISIENTPPTLRLYAWIPYCLSLGHAQRIEDVNLNALHQRQWGLVRRPTGGKAILHADELTYSVIALQNDPHVCGSILESYLRISSALLNSLKLLNIQADARNIDTINKKGIDNPVCFEITSNYEITCSGKKIIGSAQSRKMNVLLQHGAIPLHGDIRRVIDVLNYQSDEERLLATSQLCDHAGTLLSVTGQLYSWEDVAQALIHGFSETFKITLKPDMLSESEIKRAQNLMSEKYANDYWTMRM
jgi:lipoate-protein ligase A